MIAFIPICSPKGEREILKDETPVEPSAEPSTAYEPTLADTAQLLGATGGDGPYPNAFHLMHWIIDQLPELREMWRAANEVRRQGINVLDLVRLQHCLMGQLRSRDACCTAVWLLRQTPSTLALLDRLTQMRQDAGSLAQYPYTALEAFYQHSQVDRMLDDTTWTTGEEAIENLATEPCYEGLDQILGARLIRKEGDTERITAVRAALRAEAKLLTS